MAYSGVYVLGDSLVDSGNALKLAQWYGDLTFSDLPDGAPSSSLGYFQGRFSNGYTYAWTELGFRPVEWLRFGVAGQRTRIYGGERDIQRGPFVQATWRRITIGGYWFNPGSNEQVFIGSIGVAF